MTDERAPEYGCECEHPPGWHFTYGDFFLIIGFVVLLIFCMGLP